MEEGEPNASVVESGSKVAKEERILQVTQKEMEEEKTQVNHRKSHASQRVRQLGERPEPYDDEEQRHLGLCSDRWAIGELWPKMWRETRHICQKEGKWSHVEIGRVPGEIEEVWKGISLEYWYLSPHMGVYGESAGLSI